MIQAGSMGVPYIPVRGLAGTDVFERRDDMMLDRNPFAPDETYVVALAQNPDVAVLHARKADRDGNALLRRHGEDVMIAQASNRVIVTAEEIVDRVTPDDEGGQYISAINVTAVVHAPGGAHPTAVDGYYDMDRAHIEEYIAASTDDASFRAYLDRYVLGRTEVEYQALVHAPAPAPLREPVAEPAS
jgi:glutaconate CoA-transferase subunit A